jgi:hypothetical protein
MLQYQPYSLACGFFSNKPLDDYLSIWQFNKEYKFPHSNDITLIDLIGDWGGRNASPDNKGEGFSSVAYFNKRKETRLPDAMFVVGDNGYDGDYTKYYNNPETGDVFKPISQDSTSKLTERHNTIRGSGDLRLEPIGMFANEWSYVISELTSKQPSYVIDFKISFYQETMKCLLLQLGSNITQDIDSLSLINIGMMSLLSILMIFVFLQLIRNTLNLGCKNFLMENSMKRKLTIKKG